MVFIHQHTQEEKVEIYQYIIFLKEKFKNKAFTVNQYLQKSPYHNMAGSLFLELEHNHLIHKTNKHQPFRYKLSLSQEDYNFIKKEIVLFKLLKG